MTISAAAVWECRPTAGSDTNGGGYDSTISGAATDYSVQNAAQLALTDIVCSNTTTVTSVVGGFTSAMIGNAIYITGGGATTGRYFITARASTNSITVDRTPGTVAAGTGNVGGALATLGEAFGGNAAVGSNTTYIKNSGTHLVTTSIPQPATGASANYTSLVGYNSTRGDLDSIRTFANFPTVAADNANINVMLVNAPFTAVRNIIFSAGVGGTKGLRGILLQSGANPVLVENCKFTGFTDAGLYNNGNGNICFTIDCLVTATGSGGSAGFYCPVGAGSRYINCVAANNVCPGFVADPSFVTFVGCIAANNTGASSDGFQLTTSADNVIEGCDAYANGRDGIRVVGANNFDNVLVRNCILVNNVGNGLVSTVTDYSGNTTFPFISDYNAYFGNGTARSKVPAGAHDVTLTGDPFANGGGSLASLSDAATNFALNSTAGAGAACKGVGDQIGS